MAAPLQFWKRQLQRVAQQLETCKEFRLHMYRNFETPVDDYVMTATYKDFEQDKALPFGSSHSSRGDFWFALDEESNHFADSTRLQQFEVAAATFEIMPPEVRQIFSPHSLDLDREYRWCACLFDIALQNRPGMILTAHPVVMLTPKNAELCFDGKKPEPKCWHATIAHAVSGSIQLIEYLIHDQLRPRTTHPIETGDVTSFESYEPTLDRERGFPIDPTQPAVETTPDQKPTPEISNIKTAASKAPERPVWIHPFSANPPAEFCFDGDLNRPRGPIVGNRTELGACCGYAREGSSVQRLRIALKEAATDTPPALWIKESTGMLLEAYFPNTTNLSDARKRLSGYKTGKPEETQRNQRKPSETKLTLKQPD